MINHSFNETADGVETNLVESGSSGQNNSILPNTSDVCVASIENRSPKVFKPKDDSKYQVKPSSSGDSTAVQHDEAVAARKCRNVSNSSESGRNDLGSPKHKQHDIDSSRLNQHVIYFDFGTSSKCMFLEVNKKKPVPGRDEVVMEVEASTVSRTDCFIRANQWHEVARLPNIPGCDCVGKVIRCGKYAARYGVKVGDRVATIDNFLGGNARYICVPAYQLISIPQELDAAEGACLLQTFVTAYQCLHRLTKVKRGNKVLIVGANGAVGQASVQLAVLCGAEVYGTSGKMHHGLLKSMGAIPLGREPNEWLPYIKGSMDIVIDCVCSDSYFSSHLALNLLNSKSRLICVGMTAKRSNPSAFGTTLPALFVSLVAGIMPHTSCYDIFESVEDRPNEYREDFNKLVDLVLASKINPRISKLVSLRDVPKAHKKIEAGGLDGIIVCVPKLVKNNKDEKLIPTTDSLDKTEHKDLPSPTSKLNQEDEKPISSESHVCYNILDSKSQMDSSIIKQINTSDNSTDEETPNMEHSSFSTTNGSLEGKENSPPKNPVKFKREWRSMRMFKREAGRLKSKGSF
mmetsp:Transcript_38305/g.89091  ORF Transcript_38305/g.89091 Transcript_38305/m.89091 type:complete len:574 (-) Transcript_38305:267-1988(-)